MAPASNEQPGCSSYPQGQFFYQRYFQEPGVAEAEFEADLRTALKKFYVLASGGMDLSSLPIKGPDDDMPNPDILPDWLSAADLQFYSDEFTRSGIRGPQNYYRNRNHDLNWEQTAGAPATIAHLALFVVGAADGVVMTAARAVEAMPSFVTDLRVDELIPDIGHWTQQEAPDAVNERLLEFLKEVS